MATGVGGAALTHTDSLTHIDARTNAHTDGDPLAEYRHLNVVGT